MTFFSNFGNVWHTLPNGQTVLLNDITKYITIPQRFRNDSRYYLEYSIKEGDRPDLISNRLYGTVDYAWTILIMNGLSDMENKWPRSQVRLEEFIAEKYPFQNSLDVHHYEDENGLVQDPLALRLANGFHNENMAIVNYGLQPVSIFDHEYNLNEEKRKIKLLDPDYILEVDRQVKEAFNV